MYIVYSEKFRTVLVPIGKSASTSLMAWIYQIEDAEFNAHLGPQGERNLVLSEYEFKQRFGDYYIFTCVRNPFSRLVSCFLDKFVFDLFANGVRKNRENISVEAFEPSHNNFEDIETFAFEKMGGNYDAGITFEMFLQAIESGYVEGAEVPRVDAHWASQHAIGQFDNIAYNKVCRFESLSADVKSIEHDLQIPIDQHFQIFRNVQRKPEMNDDLRYYGNISAAELSKISSCRSTPVKNFFTAETLELVMEKFESDVNYFGYNHLGHL